MGRSKGYIFKIIFTIVFLIATCCSCSIQTLAFNQLNEQTKVKDSDKEAIDSVDVKEYSEEYKRWLELSEKERNLEVEPNPYYTSYYPLAGEKNKLNESFSLERKEFNALAVATTSPTYDLRDYIDITVKNQLDTQTCWTFPLISEIETNISLTRSYTSPIFSVRHMEYATSKTFLDGVNKDGFNREVGSGGNGYIGMSYLASGRGPVLESDMPFVNSEALINLAEINKQAGQHVENYVRFPTVLKEKSNGQTIYKDGDGKALSEEDVINIRNQIKEHIVTYGGVSANTNSSQTQYFNNVSPILATAYYCDDPNITPDHLITIVGWDDNYSKENFNAAHRPTKNGAWLVLNSYGTGFNGGYYYISYEDTMVGKDNTGTLIVSDRDYKNVYQYDVLGSNIHIGLRANDAPLSTVYASNVFTRKDSNAEYLSEIGVHSVGNTTVDVFVNPTGTLSLTGATQVATGLTLQEEYKTIKITNPITLTGKQFAVIVKYSSTDGNSQAQIPLEAKTTSSSTQWDTATANVNEGFVSSTGADNTWQDITSLGIGGVENPSICIKAFTKDSDNVGPIIEFETNGSTTYKRTQGTKVTVTDPSGVNNSTLRYVWTQSTSQPIDSEFNGIYENNSVVSNSKDTGNNWYLWVVAKDLQGNTTYKRTEAFYLDNKLPTAPTITSNAQNNIYTKDNASITVNGSTALSGIARYQYSLNNGTTWNDISGTIEINKSGIYQIRARAVSNVGLTGSESETYIIKIDKDAPKVSGVEEGKKYRDATPTVEDDTEVVATLKKDNEPEEDYPIKDGKGNNITEDGNYTLKVEDELGNETIIHFTIDNTGPVITFKPNGDTTYRKSQSTKVTILDEKSNLDLNSLKYKWVRNATDLVEGIFNSGATNFKNEETIVINEGTGSDYNLVIIAKDELGNTTIEKSNPFYLDNEKPSIPTISADVATGSVTNKEVEFSIGGSTALSGVKKYQYSLDGGLQWLDVNEGEKVKLTEDKTYRIIARAINNLDTEGDSTGEYVITITKAAPVINFNPNGNTLYKKTQSSTIKVTHTGELDENSFRYMWSQSTETPDEVEFTDTFRQSETVEKNTDSGAWYIWALAKDKLGNTSITRSEAFYLDNETPPAPTISSNAPNGVYIGEDATVTITGSSSPSGIRKYKYSLNNQVSWTDLAEGEQFVLNKEGIYTIYATAVNNVGKTGEVTEPYVIKIDKTAPIIKGVEEGKTYNKATPEIEDSTDTEVGLTKNGEPVPYTEGDEITEDGEYTIKATDEFGHTTIINFIIDSTPPNVTFEPNGNTTWSKIQSTKVTVTDEHGLDESTLRYKWTQSVQVLTEDTFLPDSKTFTNGSNISIDKVSGDNWYLWVYAKDKQGNMALVKTSNFCLDNEVPPAPNINASVENGGKTNTAITFNISGSSSPSGIAKYQYSLNNGEKWIDVNIGETVTLDITGVYSIIARAVNNVETKGEITKEAYVVTVDKEGPVITFNPNGNTTFKKIQSSLVKVESVVGLANDGLKYLWSQKAEGITTEEFLQSFSNNQMVTKNTGSGMWYLWIYAKDIAGANKIVRSEGFNLDNEIPNAPTIHSDTATGSVISESLEFTLSGSTSPSGIAKYQYSLDNGISWNNADPTGKVVIEKSGRYQIKARAVNNVGTIGRVSDTAFEVTIDKSPLNVTITPNENATYKKSQSAKVIIETNNEIEVSKYLWSQKEEGVAKEEITENFESGNTITKDTQSGPWFLWVYIEDNIGKQVLQRSGAFYLDNEIPEAPIVTKDVDTEKDLVNINISGSSSPSGIAKYQYSLDNGKTWNDLEKGKTLVLNEIGDYEFLARAVNNVGTEGKTTNMEIIEVVTRIPLIQFIPNGNNKYENEQSTKVRVRSSIGIDENSLYCLWTTEKEGITEEKIKEKLANGETLTKNTDSGIWYLWIIAKNVDNEVKIERSKGFYLDNDNPTIEGVEEGKTYEEIIVTVKDKTSNVTIEVLKDGREYAYSTVVDENLNNNRNTYSSGKNENVKENLNTESNSNIKNNENEESNIRNNSSDNNLSEEKMAFTQRIAFKQSGMYQINVKDEAGNISSISFVVQNKEKDITGPTATFTPNGNKKYEKIQETEVKLEDPSGVDEECIMYFWTNSTEPPEKDKFIEKFKNGDTIRNDKNTGKLYLWIYAKDKIGNESIIRSEAFYLDNSKPNKPTIDANVDNGGTTDEDVVIEVIGGQTESNIEHEYSTDGGKTWNKVEDGKIVITEEGKTTIIFRTVNEVGTLSDTTEPFIFKIKKETTTVIANNTVDNTIAKKPIPQTGVKNIILVLISVLSISAIIIAIRYWKIK